MTTFEAAYSNYNNPYSNPELEDEGEYFFNLSSIGKGLKLLAKAAAC